MIFQPSQGLMDAGLHAYNPEHERLSGLGQPMKHIEGLPGQHQQLFGDLDVYGVHTRIRRHRYQERFEHRDGIAELQRHPEIEWIES